MMSGSYSEFYRFWEPIFKVDFYTYSGTGVMSFVVGFINEPPELVFDHLQGLEAPTVDRKIWEADLDQDLFWNINSRVETRRPSI